MVHIRRRSGKIPLCLLEPRRVWRMRTCQQWLETSVWVCSGSCLIPVCVLRLRTLQGGVGTAGGVPALV